MKNKSVFFYYVKDNKKEFFSLIIMFFIGIIVGIFFINNVNDTQKNEIYVFVENLKNNIKLSDGINKRVILLQSIKQNILCVFTIWILGCSLFGSFLIYLLILYKGFSISYTVSAIIATLGIKNGCVFVLSALLIQNLVFIPMIFMLSISGIKLFKKIKTYRFENIKIEFLRYIIILLISIIGAIMSSFIEIYISTNFLVIIKDFF